VTVLFFSITQGGCAMSRLDDIALVIVASSRAPTVADHLEAT
jgi:hypothetical protein